MDSKGNGINAIHIVSALLLKQDVTGTYLLWRLDQVFENVVELYDAVEF